MSSAEHTAAALPLRVTTKAQAVYAELRERILEGTLAPGSTVNQEALAGTLGLSITPLREALRRLEGEGLVRLEAHRTLTVTPLTRRELEELYSVRSQLDPFAASLAATNASDAQIREIHMLARQRRAPTPRDQLEANRRFHRAVYASSNNLVLTNILDDLWNRTDRYRLVVLRERIHDVRTGKEHREIAAAIKSRDARRTADLVREHVVTAHVLIQQLGADL